MTPELREMLGQVAWENGPEDPPVPWAELREAEKEEWRIMAEAVARECFEEAATVCMNLGKDIVCPEECAAAIRALKGDAV